MIYSIKMILKIMMMIFKKIDHYDGAEYGLVSFKTPGNP